MPTKIQLWKSLKSWLHQLIQRVKPRAPGRSVSAVSAVRSAAVNLVFNRGAVALLLILMVLISILLKLSTEWNLGNSHR